MNYSYEIDHRHVDLGGGWRLRLLEDGKEIGGGVYPHNIDPDGIDWAWQQAEDMGAGWLADMLRSVPRL
jgi:hypothetical protein